jgi:Flp pilus assembly protein TadG
MIARLATRFRRLIGRFHSDQRGSVLVEMTLITPLMVALSGGVFEFGNLIHQKLLMEAGLNDAARFAARCNSQLYADAGLAIDCADRAKNIAVFGNYAGTGTARVPGWAKADVTITIADAGSCYDAVVAGVTQYRSTTAKVCIVRASGTKLYSGVGMLSAIGMSAITLNAAHEERYIRF